MNKNPPLVEKDTLYEMYEVQKLPMHTIAKRLGVSVGAIHKYIHLYEFDIHRILPPKSEEEKARISKVHKGKRVSLETRKKISDAKTKNLKGHKKLRKDGYIAIYYPSYPTSNKCGYVMEHKN